MPLAKEALLAGKHVVYANVYLTIMGEAELIVKPEQGRNTIRIIELARQSSAKKRTLAYSHV